MVSKYSLEEISVIKVFLNFHVAEKKKGPGLKKIDFIFLIDFKGFFELRSWFIKVIQMFLRCFYTKIN